MAVLLLILWYSVSGAFADTTTRAPPPRPCEPYISEMSNLTLGNSKALQYIELQVKEMCRGNRKSMQEMEFSDYGLLIMHTKSRERGNYDAFEMKTFVKFSKCNWHKKRHEENAKKGGRRVADSFRAFFVVGGPATLAPSLTPSDRVGEAITWDMYEAEIGTKCGSLINWPHCEQEVPQGQGSLEQFLVKSSTSVVLSIPSEKELLQGQTVYVLVKFNHDKRKEEADYFSREFSYVQFDARRNKYFAADKLHITKEKQEWIASRAKDIVVITPSLDEGEILPLHRLKHLFSQISPKRVHVLPRDFSTLKSDESFSRCSEEEQVFAVTKRSPGSENLCEEDIVYLESTSMDDVCYQEDVLQQIDNEPESVPMEMDDMYEPHYDVLMDVDVADVPTPSAGRSHHGLVHKYCREILRKQERSQLTIDRLLQGEESLQKGMCVVDANIKQMKQKVDEQEELRKQTENFAVEGVRRKYGMQRDPQLRMKLKKLGSVGINFSEKTLDYLERHEWLELILDNSDLENSFFRCKLCNREHPVRDVVSTFIHCSRMTSSDDGGKKTNLLGLAKVLCVKQLKKADGKSWAYAISRAVGSHPSTKEHSLSVDLYKEALAVGRLGSNNLAIPATIISTLSAYTIAKEGLPLSSQFPLMMFALRSGAPVGTSHYEATSAKRMINNYATHIEYELWRYLIENDLPFSILMDGSSSSRGTKWMAYMIRSLTPSHEPYTFHLLLAEVARETGDSITEILLSHLKKREERLETPGLVSPPHDYAMKNLVAITTDGASVMVGHADGVFGRLRKEILERTRLDFSPRKDLLLSVCAAHKLNLAMKDVKHSGYALARAFIMEMHAIFGATQSSSARRLYKDTARAMAYTQLQMGQFFAIRWSDSFRHGLGNVVRMWPVLIESLRMVSKDRSIAYQTRTRAKIASYVMRDGRVFLMMKHVLHALARISTLSLFLQNTDSLAVDAMEAMRTATRSLIDGSLIEEVHEELTQSTSVLNLYDGHRRKQVTKQFLLQYYSPADKDEQQSKWRLVYLPERFKDFKGKLVDESTEEEENLRLQLTSFKEFRSLEASLHDEKFLESFDLESDALRFGQDDSPDIDSDITLDFGLGYIYRKFLTQLGGKLIRHEVERMHREIYEYVKAKMGDTSIPANMFWAADRHIILDIIDFEGDFQKEWEYHVPEGATWANRGRPDYIDKHSNRYDARDRNHLISQSIVLLETYCVIPKLKEPLFSFYSTLHKNVKDLQEWPHDLRMDKTSKRLYKSLLIFQNELDMPEEVESMLKCILVIPSSNADSERTFSTANRLTSGERNSISTKTVNNMMHIQKNGPSLLTVSPSKLAEQWINPLHGLNLPPGHHSLHKSSTTMATIREALMNRYVRNLKSVFLFFLDKLNAADSLRKIIGTEVNVEALLNVFGEQALKRSVHGGNAEILRNDIIAVEKAKAEIFSIGQLHESKG